MSEKKKYPLVDACLVAAEIHRWLEPLSVDQIRTCGSVRRQKKEVSDVEILYVPKFVNDIPKDMFEPAELVSAAGRKLLELIDKGILAKRPNKNGITSWGELNKLAIHVASGIPVDLFATEAQYWWTALVIRTGGKMMNLELTTGARKMNRCLHAYGNIEVLRTKEILQPGSEEEVFKLCGVRYREPQERF